MSGTSLKTALYLSMLLRALLPQLLILVRFDLDTPTIKA